MKRKETIRLNKVSEYTGVVYTKKLVKKLFRNKKLNVVIPDDKPPVNKYGIFKVIDIIDNGDSWLLLGEVKSDHNITRDDIELRFGFFHESTLGAPRKSSEFIDPYVYYIDKELEGLMSHAIRLGYHVSKDVPREYVNGSNCAYMPHARITSLGDLNK